MSEQGKSALTVAIVGNLVLALFVCHKHFELEHAMNDVSKKVDYLYRNNQSFDLEVNYAMHGFPEQIVVLCEDMVNLHIEMKNCSKTLQETIDTFNKYKVISLK